MENPRSFFAGLSIFLLLPALSYLQPFSNHDNLQTTGSRIEFSATLPGLISTVQPRDSGVRNAARDLKNVLPWEIHRDDFNASHFSKSMKANFDAGTEVWTFTGETESSYFGYSVGNAGDVNGDGYSDIVAGAFAHGSGRGKVYVYYGSSNGPGSSNNWTRSGETASSYFGVSVSSAGDVNGDGYGDVIIGASGYSSNSGKVYLFSGAPSGLGSSPSWTFTGESAGSYLGLVSCAGDVNNDGYSDVVIGANGFENFKGKAYVFFGSKNGLSSNPQWTATGETSGNYFGTCVSGAGDVNGDDYDDVLISTDGYNGNLSKAYVYYGSKSGLPSFPDWSRSEESPNSYFGYSSSSAGDVNGDGFDDIIVGALGHNFSTGSAYVYFGDSAGLSLTPSWTVIGESYGSEFGYSVSTACDIDNDGFSDVLIGADGFIAETGKIYLYKGSEQGLSHEPSWISTGFFRSRFGSSVSSAGDVNNDGYTDIVCGAYKYDYYTGRINVFRGSDCGIVTDNWVTTGINEFDRFGYCVGSAGDVNGDNLSDILVGSYGSDQATGKAFLFQGGTCGVSSVGNWITSGESVLNNFGAAASSAGDVNNDGYDDVLIGAPGYNSNSGKVYFYSGSDSGLSQVASWTYAGGSANNYLGTVSSAGDVNNDGYDDIIIGEPGNAGFKGKAYLFLGSQSGPVLTPSWSYSGESAGNYFGFCVSEAGDVNNDGYDDVLISTDGYNGNIGKAYVFYGNAGGLSSAPDWTATDGVPGSVFGYSSSSAGDVNGDGFGDIIIGALGFMENRGRAYLYLGSPGGLGSAPAWTATGESAGSEFGYSVASAGDLNGDGRSEVIVGADGFDDQRGRIYIYRGTSSGLSQVPSWTKTGEEYYQRSGNSVCSAGDTDGDKRNEILAGSYRFGYYYFGKACLFNGADIIIGIDEISENLPEFYLHQNFPNPFNPSTTISYSMSRSGNVVLKVFDLNGKEVVTLVNEYKHAGSYSVMFDAARFSSGVYFYSLSTSEGIAETRKCVLVK